MTERERPGEEAKDKAEEQKKEPGETAKAEVAREGDRSEAGEKPIKKEPLGREAAEKKGPTPKKEKPEKCEQCGKNLSRVKWYYRNNGYYCNKRCWSEFRKKQEEKKKAEVAEQKA